MKIFKQELLNLYDKLCKEKPFAFSKYADGEWAIMNDIQLNNGEFESRTNQEFYKNKLIESFQYQDNNYIVGISCECCQGAEHYKMKKFSNQKDENLTYANIFVNSNYELYKETFIKEYSNHSVHLIANKNSKV